MVHIDSFKEDYSNGSDSYPEIITDSKAACEDEFARIKTKRGIKNSHYSFPFCRKFPVLQDNNNHAPGVFLYQQITSV